MIIDKEFFETRVWEFGKMEGQKYYKFIKIAPNVGAYVGAIGETWFELDTLERIGNINEADVRSSRNRYYYSTCSYGWDGKKKTKKEQVATLCTKADYMVAKNLLLAEYKARKQ